MSTRINPHQVLNVTIQENGDCQLWMTQAPGPYRFSNYKKYSPQDQEAYEHCINIHSYFKNMVEPKKY